MNPYVVFVLASALFAAASCYSEDDVVRALDEMRGNPVGENVPAECADDGHCVWTIEPLDDIGDRRR